MYHLTGRAHVNIQKSIEKQTQLGVEQFQCQKAGVHAACRTIEKNNTSYIYRMNFPSKVK